MITQVLERGRRIPAVLWLVRALGFVLAAIGLINLLIPTMPTTIFLILALGCWTYADPEMAQRLLAHPRFGPTLRGWQEYRGIQRRTKVLAISTIVVLFGISVWLVPSQAWRYALIALGCTLVGYLASRPEPA